ncbi:MAG: serine/threonine-protein kinase [Candidatus Acidiferrales bacterium]
MIEQTIAHYRILQKIGAGGMGEVYSAQDSRLGREVALKIVPEAFAKDPERMARLDREAKLLASLNHPNIAFLFGLEESGSLRALVMELVEGPTLADRIKQGPIAIGEALPVAKQIPEALEHAHERGIVHRDLKPSNVKVKSDGHVKVLDFGLAKALEDGPAAQDISSSPTLSGMATRVGIILGTAAYMSPEQAKGKPADRRADVWAFGVVLFEMLSGKQLFTGETASEVLANVITQEPKWEKLPAGVPPRIQELLRHCLTKDPKQRLQAIGEARIVLEDVVANPHADATTPAALGRTAQSQWLRNLPWVASGLLALVFLLSIWKLWPRAAAIRMEARHTETIPEHTLRGTASGVFAGRPLARLFVERVGNQRSIRAAVPRPRRQVANFHGWR